MTDHDDRHDDLDQRIRDLVARAAADTPPAPRLDEGALVGASAPTDRNRWIVGGVAGLSIAAATIAILVLARPAERADPLIPSTDSTIAVTLPTTTTLGPTGSIPATPDTTEAIGTPTSTTLVLRPPFPTSVPDVSSPTTVSVPSLTPDLVIAGPDGVRWGETVVTAEPMARALPMPDGRVLMQRQYNTSRDVVGSAILVVEPGSTEPTPVAVPAEFDGRVLRLHDLAAVNGEVVVVVETGPEPCVGFDNCIGAIWAWGPDSGRLDQLQERSVWEGGWTRLSIAQTGLVFGAETDLAERTLRSWIVPGTDATPIDVAALGLSETYVECDECPSGFGVDRRGVHVAWIETDLTTSQTSLMVAPVGGEVGRFPLTDGGTICCLDGAGTDLPFVPAVELDVAQPDVAIAEGLSVVINDEGVLNGGGPRPALVVEPSTGEVRAAPGFHVFG